MQKLTAIILFSRNVGEFDRMYFLYSRENGLMKAIGKGVRKPAARLAGHLEPGTLSEIYIARSRGIGQITSAITLTNFDNLKKNFKTLSEILAVFRFFVKNFSEGEKEERIFDLLVEFLDLLSRKTPTPPSLRDTSPQARFAEASARRAGEEVLIIEAFWWKLFDFLGSRPEIMKCSNCGAKLSEKERKYFSSQRGGAVCEKCPRENSEIEISASQIKLLRIILSNSLENILKVRIENRELGRLGKIREEFRKFNF